MDDAPKAIIVGSGSDIGTQIRLRLTENGWIVRGFHRDDVSAAAGGWDLAIICCGSLEPIGKWSEASNWIRGLDANALTPIHWLKVLWPSANPGAMVCLFDGPTFPAPTYSAYRCGKVLLEEWMRCVTDEDSRVKVFMLHTGVVQTKIHRQTMRAGQRAANLDRVKAIIDGKEETTSHEAIFDALEACLESEAVRGKVYDVRSQQVIR